MVGPSGSGKSSVVLGGILPAIRAGWLHPSDVALTWRIAVIVPGSDPEQSLADAAILLTDKNLFVVVDQFEELFTLCNDPMQRNIFVDALLSLVDHSNIVMLTLRSDF